MYYKLILIVSWYWDCKQMMPKQRLKTCINGQILLLFSAITSRPICIFSRFYFLFCFVILRFVFVILRFVFVILRFVFVILRFVFVILRLVFIFLHIPLALDGHECRGPFPHRPTRPGVLVVHVVMLVRAVHPRRCPPHTPSLPAPVVNVAVGVSHLVPNQRSGRCRCCCWRRCAHG